MFEDSYDYVMLVGLPGSGKTTLRNFLLKQFWMQPVSSDDGIEAYAEAHQITYTKAFPRAIKEATRTMWNAMSWCIQNQRSIVHDQTNLTPEKREEALRFIPDNYRRLVVVCEVPERVRQQRLHEREGKKIPSLVDENMQSVFAYPAISEGWDGIFTDRGLRLSCSRGFLGKSTLGDV